MSVTSTGEQVSSDEFGIEFGGLASYCAWSFCVLPWCGSPLCPDAQSQAKQTLGHGVAGLAKPCKGQGPPLPLLLMLEEQVGSWLNWFSETTCDTH